MKVGITYPGLLAFVHLSSAPGMKPALKRFLKAPDNNQDQDILLNGKMSVSWVGAVPLWKVFVYIYEARVFFPLEENIKEFLP